MDKVYWKEEEIVLDAYEKVANLSNKFLFMAVCDPLPVELHRAILDCLMNWEGAFKEIKRLRRQISYYENMIKGLK
jgi:hypothetical protein